MTGIKKKLGKIFGRERLREIHRMQKQTEDRVNSIASEIAQIKQLLNQKSPLNEELSQIKQTLNMLSTKNSVEHKKLRVFFLVHNIGAWESLSTVHQCMLEDDGFEVLTASVNRRFAGSDVFRDEEIMHGRLDELNIPHIRFNNPDSFQDLDVIKTWAPDIIFRQSQWDPDIPPAFSTENLRFAKFCYIPYGMMHLISGVHSKNSHGSYFHQSCEMIFCANTYAYNTFLASLPNGKESLYITGHPKVKTILNAEPNWPIKHADGRKNYRVVWSAHHAIHTGWSNFGTFLQVYSDMLQWAKTSPDIDFVFSLHPALTMGLEGLESIELRESVAQFFKEWESLENTSIFRDGVYGSLLAASDLLVTDGVSWLMEYQIFHDKPLVFIEREDHVPFTEVGAIFESGLYKARNFEQAKNLVLDLKTGEKVDVLKDVRQSNYERLLKNDDCPTNIIELIKERFRSNT